MRARGGSAGGGAAGKAEGGDLQPDKSIAMAHARSLAKVFAALKHLSADDAAATLNARGVPTPHGKPWSAVMVIRTRDRIGKIARGD
jgi:hypothetical protein